MKMLSAIVLSSFGMLITFPSYAYRYTFNNKSDLDAEVQFQLKADIVANYPYETVKVAKNSTGAIIIPEWWRSGLCIDLSSIKIKFLSDGVFKQPWPVRKAHDFEQMVKTKLMPESYSKDETLGVQALSAEDWVNSGKQTSFGIAFEIACGDQVFDFTYHIKNNHPVIRRIE